MGWGADKRKQEKGGIGKGKGDRETRTRDEGWGMVMGEWYCYKGGIYFLFVDPLSSEKKMPRGVIDGDGKKERRRGVKKWGEI